MVLSSLGRRALNQQQHPVHGPWFTVSRLGLLRRTGTWAWHGYTPDGENATLSSSAGYEEAGVLLGLCLFLSSTSQSQPVRKSTQHPGADAPRPNAARSRTGGLFGTVRDQPGVSPYQRAPREPAAPSPFGPRALVYQADIESAVIRRASPRSKPSAFLPPPSPCSPSIYTCLCLRRYLRRLPFLPAPVDRERALTPLLGALSIRCPPCKPVSVPHHINPPSTIRLLHQPRSSNFCVLRSSLSLYSILDNPPSSVVLVSLSNRSHRGLGERYIYSSIGIVSAETCKVSSYRMRFCLAI
ncbi:hypothetical protein VTN96DRAFT_5877 [Rasamsonia emersonii]